MGALQKKLFRLATRFTGLGRFAPGACRPLGSVRGKSNLLPTHMAQWEEAQKKAFTKWINGQLGQPDRVTDIIADLQDGLVLMDLVQKLFPNIPVPKYSKQPKMRVHKLDNMTNVLSMIEQAGVKLEFVKPISIVDGNQTLVLGLIWTLICEGSIKSSLQAIGVQGKSGGGADQGLKELLLTWCRKRTEGYKDVDIRDFTSSFKDGLAFCAIIHSLKPSVIKYDQLYKENGEPNLKYAFQVAEKKLGIPPLLEVEDMREPDEKSVMTYVSEFLKYYAMNDGADRGPSKAEEEERLRRQREEEELRQRRKDEKDRLRRLEEEERQRQLELERQRVAEELERQRAAAEADRLRQMAELERLRADQQRQQEEWERQRQQLLSQQQQLAEDERRRQEELQRQRQADMQRQQAEMERQRLEFERRQLELEQQQRQAAEEARQAREEAERRQRQLEHERRAQQAMPPPQQAYPPQMAVPPQTGQQGHHVKRVVKKKKSSAAPQKQGSTTVITIQKGGKGGAQVIRTSSGGGAGARMQVTCPKCARQLQYVPQPGLKKLKCAACGSKVKLA